jgi:hypothetical protein
VDARCRAATGRPFIDASAAQQLAVLATHDAAALAARALDPSGPQPFFREMKWLTLFGYYTSEIGVTRELRQSIASGRYDPCAPVAPDGAGGS